jgi:hypothetical protein
MSSSVTTGIEHGDTTGTPAGRRLNRKRSPDCRFHPEAPTADGFASDLTPVMKVSQTKVPNPHRLG